MIKTINGSKNKNKKRMATIMLLVFIFSTFLSNTIFPDTVLADVRIKSKLDGTRVTYADPSNDAYEFDVVISSNINFPAFQDGDVYEHDGITYDNTVITSDSSDIKTELTRLAQMQNALVYKDLIMYYFEERYPKAASYLYVKSAFNSWADKADGPDAFLDMYLNASEDELNYFDSKYWSAVIDIFGVRGTGIEGLLEELIDNNVSIDDTDSSEGEGVDEEGSNYEFGRSAVVESGFREFVESFTKAQLEVEPLGQSTDGMGISYRESSNIKLTTLYQLSKLDGDKGIFKPAKLKGVVFSSSTGIQSGDHAYDYYIYIPEDLLEKEVSQGASGGKTFQELIENSFPDDENIDGVIVDGLIETDWSKEPIEGKFLKVFDLQDEILRAQIASAMNQFQENSIGDLNGNDLLGKTHGSNGINAATRLPGSYGGSPANILDCYLTIDNVGNIALNTKEILVPWYENRYFIDNNLIGANLFVGSTYVNEVVFASNDGYTLISPVFRLFSDNNKIIITPKNFTSSIYSCMNLLRVDELEFDGQFFGEGAGMYSESIFFNVGKDLGKNILIFSPVCISNTANIEKQLEVLGTDDGQSVFARMNVLNEVIGQAKDEITEVSTSYFAFNPFRDPSAVSPEFSDSSTIEKTQDNVLNMVQDMLSTGLLGIISKTCEALTAEVYSEFNKGISGALFYSPDINEITLFKIMRNYIVAFSVIMLLILLILQFIMAIRGKLSVKEIVKGIALALVCVFLPLSLLPWLFSTVFNGTTNFIMSKEVNAAVVADINSMNKFFNSSLGSKLSMQNSIDASGSYLKFGDMNIPLLILIPWEIPNNANAVDMVEMLNKEIEEKDLTQFNKYDRLYNNGFMKEIKDHYREIINETRVEGADCRINQKVGFLDKYTPAFVSKEDSIQKSGNNEPYRYIDHYYNSLKIAELLASSGTWYDTYYYYSPRTPEEIPFTYEGNLIPQGELSSFLGSLNYVTSTDSKERGWQASDTGLTSRQKDKLVNMVEEISDTVAEKMETQFGDSGNNYLGTSTFYETYLDSITLYTFLAIMEGTSTIVDNRQDMLRAVPTSVGIDSINADIFIRSLLMSTGKLATSTNEGTVAYAYKEGIIQGLLFLVLVALLTLYAIFNLVAKFFLIIAAVPVFFMGYVVYKDFSNKAWIGFLYSIVIIYGIHVGFLLLFKLCVYINNI